MVDVNKGTQVSDACLAQGPGHAAGPVQDAFNPGGGAGNNPAQQPQGNGNAPGQNGGVPAGNPGAGAGGGVRVNPAGGQPPVRGFLAEVQALVIGFFTSLLPGGLVGHKNSREYLTPYMVGSSQWILLFVLAAN